MIDKKVKGFTLVELLVVVLIIGILAAIALPQYEKAVEKSRASEVYNILKDIYTAETIFFMTNGRYTANLSELDFKFPYSITKHNQYYQGGDFYWRISNDDKSMYAGRNYKDGFYFIQIHFPEGDFICAAKQNTQAKDICLGLGFTEKYHTSGATVAWINSSGHIAEYYKNPGSTIR